MPVSQDHLEWLRSPEAADQNLTKEDLERYEDLRRRTVLVEAHIREAFKGCTLGDGIGLLEADAWDMCINPEEARLAREQDERDDWEKLSEDDLYKCRQALCFTDAQGYRFLLPALMLADMVGDLDEMIVIHLSLTKEDLDGTRSLLNGDQVAAVVEFLNLYLDDPDCNFHHPSITESLDIFWTPLLRQRIRDAEQKSEDDPPRSVFHL